MTINLNARVWVRLTESGRGALLAAWTHTTEAKAIHNCDVVYPGWNKGRWIAFQLWELCNTFGSYLSMGGDILFIENSVRFDDPTVDSVTYEQKLALMVALAKIWRYGCEQNPEVAVAIETLREAMGIPERWFTEGLPGFAVSSSQIADGAVSTAKIDINAVTTPELAPQTVLMPKPDKSD